MSTLHEGSTGNAVGPNAGSRSGCSANRRTGNQSDGGDSKVPHRVKREALHHEDLQPYDCFLSMFPHDHLIKIVQWSSKRLAEAGKRQTSIGEILLLFVCDSSLAEGNCGSRKDVQVYSCTSVRSYRNEQESF